MDLLPVHEDLVEFVNAGVSGFIMKDATLDDLVHTIRVVAEGGHMLPPQMTSTLFSQIARDALARGREEEVLEAVRMTPRERQVIDLIGDGLSNKRDRGASSTSRPDGEEPRAQHHGEAGAAHAPPDRRVRAPRPPGLTGAGAPENPPSPVPPPK